MNVPGYTILNNNQSIYNESYESTECSESKWSKTFSCVDFREYHKYSILIQNIRYSESYECSKAYMGL